jgi:hypothetical protein
MQRRAIAKVILEPSGKLLVCPHIEARVGYEYIYREANGLRWDREKRALVAYEPSRWKHEELLEHIAATLRHSFDEELHFTEQTEWVGASPELQSQLQAVLAHGESFRERDA